MINIWTKQIIDYRYKIKQSNKNDGFKLTIYKTY